VVDLFVARNAHLRGVVARKGRLAARIRALLKDVTALFAEEASTSGSGDAEAGDGLAAPLARGEGLRRLQAYATPIAIEEWAGEVAGPAELGRRFGVSRSTLHDWQKRGAVVGLLAGQRKHVFPVAQFIDGRPLEGLAEIVTTAGAPRTAWLWLVEPHPSLGGRTPLDRLRRGEQATVIDLAEREFGQP
jgi:hypothetical protein